jgi:hypothetical protein
MGCTWTPPPQADWSSRTRQKKWQAHFLMAVQKEPHYANLRSYKWSAAAEGFWFEETTILCVSFETNTR